MLNNCESINHLAIQYSESTNTIIKDICHPLERNFAINYFAYLKHFPNGYYLGLSNNLEINTYYIKNVFTASKVWKEAINNIENNKPYYFLWPNCFQSLSRSEELILSKYHSLNIWNGFTVYRKVNDEIESWSF